MAWVRKLPSGRWAATVRLPGGRKLTRSDKLKGSIERWASDQEASLRRGDWIDPRHGELTVGEWWDRCKDSRILEKASRKRDESHWRCHVEPYWSRWQLASILQPDVTRWVSVMQKQERVTAAGEKVKLGADTIIGSVKVFRTLMEQAVAAKLIRFNPARGVKVPRPNALTDRVLAPHEDVILLDALRDRFGDRPDGALFVELLLDAGLRWEEAAGLSRSHVDLRRQRIHVVDVMERDGTVRSYPKSKAGERDVPIGDTLWPVLRAHVMTLPPTALVFTSQLGKPLRYTRWRARVWVPALTVVTERGGRNGQHILATRPLLADPQPTPHDMRHTYGTRLAEQGVPQHEIMALMGHKDVRAVQRYLHAGEARFARARKALDAARSSGGSHAAHDLGVDGKASS